MVFQDPNLGNKVGHYFLAFSVDGAMKHIFKENNTLGVNDFSIYFKHRMIGFLFNFVIDFIFVSLLSYTENFDSQ